MEHSEIVVMIFIVYVSLHFRVTVTFERAHEARQLSIGRSFFVILEQACRTFEKSLADHFWAFIASHNPGFELFQLSEIV